MKAAIAASLIISSTSGFAFKSDDAEKAIFSSKTFDAMKMRNIGPAYMSGRISDIAVDQKDPSTWYTAVASGGVWKTINAGTTWKPIFDKQAVYSTGDVTIDPNNSDIIWVGTGENNGGRHISFGDGVYKSIDGGKTWKKILYSNERSGIADLIIDPKNPNKLFATLYEHSRTPYYFTSGGTGSGLYVTYNGGEDWKRIGENEGMPSGELGRIGLAIAHSDPDRVYAKVEATKNALYRSDDGGLNWTMINDNPRFTNNRPFYFQELAVDTKDPNRLYNIYQPLSVSYDGGISFDPVPMIPADETKGIHADFHSFWVNPVDPHHFIIGGDGGIGITQDHGKSWYFPETIPVAQFYHINVDNDRPYNVYGGMQDNGNWSGPGYTWKRGGIRTLYWQYLVGGDGFHIAPDLDDSRFGYGTSQNGNLYRYDKLTGYYVSIKPPQPSLDTRLRFNWNAGFAKNPHDASSLYYSSQFVHVTHDKGATWEVISPDLTTNNPAHQKPDYGGLTLDVSGAEMYNSIISIAPSPVDKNVIWAGTDDGQVQLTKDGGKTWNNLTKQVEGMPNEAWVAQIKASRYQAGAAWMVVNNYRKGDYSPYLFKTENFGKSWTRMADDTKVKGYALSVVEDPVEPNLVFLGTENGLWISIDKGNSWVQFKNGFPSVSTMDMTIQEPESALIVGTFGRAIWVLDDLLSLREVAGKRLEKGITAFPMNDAVQVKGLFINPPGNIWTGFNTTFEGENKVFQRTEIPFYINGKNALKEPLEASIYDVSGSLIKTLKSSNDLVEGLNYMTWQLDEQSLSAQGRRKGIPVLPGDYRIVLSHSDQSDETSVRVIEDPRFDLDASIDKGLYDFRKELDIEMGRITNMFSEIDKREQMVAKLKGQLSEARSEGAKKILEEIESISKGLKALRAKGQTPRPTRQVGAWQSFEVSPFSKLMEVRRLAAARTTAISDQNRSTLKDASNLIDGFEKEVNKFLNNDWESFKKLIEESDVNWF